MAVRSCHWDEPNGAPRWIARRTDFRSASVCGLAGGGVKSGGVYGATDDFGHRAVENPVLHTDSLATLLHLFGLSAEEVTYTRNKQQLTILDNQPARVVKEILA